MTTLGGRILELHFRLARYGKSTLGDIRLKEVVGPFRITFNPISSTIQAFHCPVYEQKKKLGGEVMSGSLHLLECLTV